MSNKVKAAVVLGAMILFSVAAQAGWIVDPKTGSPASTTTVQVN